RGDVSTSTPRALSSLSTIAVAVADIASIGDDATRAAVELAQVPRRARPHRATPEPPLVGEEHPERERADADLDDPRPVLPRHEALDHAREQQSKGEAHDDREESAAILRERLRPGARPRR